jgi:hypothetical protein
LLFKVIQKRLSIKYETLKEKNQIYDVKEIDTESIVHLNKNEDFVLILESFRLTNSVTRVIMLTSKGVVYDDFNDYNFKYYFEKI